MQGLPSIERKDERARIGSYEAEIMALSASLTEANYKTATEIAALASSIRGFGHVKQQNAEKAAEQLERLQGTR